MTIYKPGAFCYAEITSQGKIWNELIPLIISQSAAIQRIAENSQEYLFVGCGSSLNASYTGAAIFQTLTNIPARAVPAAEIYLFPKSVLRKDGKTLAVLLSRSGKTTEVLQALDYLHRNGVSTIGITCQGGSPLTEQSDLGLVLSLAKEQAVVTTRSLTAMIIALQLISAIISGNQNLIQEIQSLPEVCNVQMPFFNELGKTIGNRTDLIRYAFVGNGPFWGLSRECQLKIKEMTLQPSDAFPMLDFRHGPQSTVDERLLVTAMISDSARLQEIQFLRDMRTLKGITWALCDHSDEKLRASTSYILELNSGLSELVRCPLYMPAIQFMAYYRALALGFNPDEPRNLSYWINTSSL
jgi:glucosamine--fructose-6-phosphate aminotransferase (isomerizing)